MHMIWIWFLILLLSVYQTAFTDYFLINPDFYQLDAYTWECEDFRRMLLGNTWIDAVSRQPELNYDCLASLMIQHQYDLRDLDGEEWKQWQSIRASLLRRKPVEYKKLRRAYEMIFQDIGCFPIPKFSESVSGSGSQSDSSETAAFITYEDSFLEPRTYGGERQHEGCDLMGIHAPRGHYPVLSMTSGTIEKVGWLEKGGWRMGIRTPSGAYFYYAHLYRYAEDWKEGDLVQPGTLLGFMGDSGYGVREGTVGNFDVHLHLGIYLPTDHYDELSINPYWVLKYSERFMRRAEY